MSSGFRLDARSLINGLSETESRAMTAIRLYAENGALALQNYARRTARWTDRTGSARQRLKGDTLPMQNGYKLRLAHGVNYGIWLELAHEKRFAIIEETIETVGSNEIMPGFENLLNRLGGGSTG